MPSRTDFDRLALPHLAAVYRLARQLSGPDRADDLTQETFLRAWSHFHQFDPGTNCRAWLCRILHNTWISHWRKTRFEVSSADLDHLPAEPTYDWERERFSHDLSADMQWALVQLPDAYRWAVLLADVEELSYREIAAITECPIGTVMSRISRGRQLLGRLVTERRAHSRRATSLRIVGRER